jgi:hypothetical protein
MAWRLLAWTTLKFQLSCASKQTDYFQTVVLKTLFKQALV